MKFKLLLHLSIYMCDGGAYTLVYMQRSENNTWNQFSPPAM